LDDIRVGTASWTDKTLIDSKRFYPEDAKTAEKRLRFYASRFATTEVDSSYYGLPSARNAQLWTERTPAHFSFVVKAFRLFTLHHTAPDALPKDLRTALGPLTKKNLYLCVEFRNRTWFDEGHRDDVLKFEREHALSHVVVDEPQGFASSVPWVGEVTAPRQSAPMSISTTTSRTTGRARVRGQPGNGRR
jgi:uncharacterized protein YecE (DUF72 family)